MNTHESWKTHSRLDWGWAEGSPGCDLEKVRLGCLQRIASALESLDDSLKMLRPGERAKAVQALQEDERYRRRADRFDVMARTARTHLSNIMPKDWKADGSKVRKYLLDRLSGYACDGWEEYAEPAYAAIMATKTPDDVLNLADNTAATKRIRTRGTETT